MTIKEFGQLLLDFDKKNDMELRGLCLEGGVLFPRIRFEFWRKNSNESGYCSFCPLLEAEISRSQLRALQWGQDNGFFD